MNPQLGQEGFIHFLSRFLFVNTAATGRCTIHKEGTENETRRKG
jgi:hypothetical protein